MTEHACPGCIATAADIVRECQRIHARGTKPNLPEIKPLVEAYYQLDGNGAGGELHVVLDDGNWEKCFIREIYDRAKQDETKWLAAVLLMLSNSQLRKV